MLTPDQIQSLLQRRYSDEESREILTRLTPEHVTDEVFSTFLSAISQCAEALSPIEAPLMDCCGTGGSGLSHYNTSTTVAFILASCGVNVVKFGNRGLTSQSGSFDFLEGLGLPAQSPLNALPEIVAQSGVAFLFAPQVYPALANFNQLRKALGIKTIFNFMGPLLHPYKPSKRLIGVSHPTMQATMARWLAANQATETAWLVRADNNLDEISPETANHIISIENNTLGEKSFTSPTPIALPTTPLSVTDNLQIFNQLATGEDTQSPYYHLVCLNACAALYVAGVISNFQDGIALVQKQLKEKALLAQLQKTREAYASYTR